VAGLARTRQYSRLPPGRSDVAAKVEFAPPETVWLRTIAVEKLANLEAWIV
jgi:hypothetical protein